MTDLTPELREFLQAWLDWAENGAPDGEPFSRRYGLCDNAERAGLGKKVFEVMRHEFGPLMWEFPFGDSEEYLSRCDAATQHENPARLAWVRAKLGVTP